MTPEQERDIFLLAAKISEKYKFDSLFTLACKQSADRVIEINTPESPKEEKFNSMISCTKDILNQLEKINLDKTSLVCLGAVQFQLTQSMVAVSELLGG